MKRTQKGITLVALVVTIIILIILAGISISALSGSGLFARANDAKIEAKMSEIEEFATLKVYELYIENANNMDAVNDATITTALKTELQAKGYEIKDVNTTSETVNGLKIQDSTGQNNFESISLLQQKNTTIKIDLDITSQSKTYVKIDDNWHELIINDKTVKISREKYEGPVNSENTYEIKLTPPASGITMTAGETPITSETAITPGALITIKSGNDIGIFAFNVKETTGSVTKNVNVKVEADPTYATDLSIAVEGGEYAEVVPGKTLQLVATKTPTTSTDTVSWNIKSGSATIDATGKVTANSTATIGSKIIVSAICNRKDGTTTTVSEKTLEIIVQKTVTAQQIAATPKLYYGKKVLNYKASDSDTNTYRIFYVSTTDNEFGDPQYTIYLKADDSLIRGITCPLSTAYRADTKIKEMNPLWATKRGEESWFTSEKAAAYLSSPVTSNNSTLPWVSYFDSIAANYVIGGPSLEMYVKSYNQTHDKNSNGIDPLGFEYRTSYVDGYGYKTYGVSGLMSGVDSIDYSSTYNSMYCGITTNGTSKKEGVWFMCSPSAYGGSYMCCSFGVRAELEPGSYDGKYGISPVVSLKSSFRPQIE